MEPLALGSFCTACTGFLLVLSSLNPSVKQRAPQSQNGQPFKATGGTLPPEGRFRVLVAVLVP